MKVLYALAVCLLFALPAAADDTYAVHYGDGMRAYTEARYDEALTHLYRAFAVRQEPLALKLIARAHDFQGNCAARESAVRMMGELFPRSTAPPPQLCAQTGVVEIQCNPSDGPVRVDDRFDAACGTVRLPVGSHEIAHPALGLKFSVVVNPNKPAVATFRQNWRVNSKPAKFAAAPRRWTQPNLLADPDMPRTFEWKRPAILDDRAK